MEDFEIAIKVLIVGNGGVGKSSLIRRFCKGTFTDQYKKTIGVDFLEKQQNIPSIGETVTMMLWDTAGQEEFDAVTRAYYRGAGAAVLAFSTTDRASFDAVEAWKGKIEAECGPLPMAIIQNKIDLIDQALMTPEEAESLAKKLNVKFYRTSVKEDFNVNNVFEYLAEQHIKTTKQANTETKTTQQIATVNFDEKDSSSSDKDKDGDRDRDKKEDKPTSKSFQLTSSTNTSEKDKASAPEKRRTGGKKSMCSI